MPLRFDVAVIGSGFGGSLLAMIANRLGRSVVLLERSQHPRFAIGESSTPLANLLLEEIARQYALPGLLPLAKWGSWQKAYPEIGCGLKRGFTFYHHQFGKSWTPVPERKNQLLVAASPHAGIADTHWYRPDFDHLLVREAQAQGVEFLDRTKLEKLETGSTGFTLRGQRAGEPLSCQARFIVDASGSNGFLRDQLGLEEEPFPHLPPTEGLYSHFSSVQRLEEVAPSGEKPPYAVDDAAVHHLFEGGWIWVLRFNNGLTSAGVAATGHLAKQLRLHEGAGGWKRLLERLPTVSEQFSSAKPEIPFLHTPQLSFRSRASAGPGWALLPSAAGFVDPLLSTGFPLTLLGVARLGRIIEADWGSERFDSALHRYSAQTLRELNRCEEMVSALYANLTDFSLFSALSLLYFAAATFTETARRLGRPELAGDSFLLGDHPIFGLASIDCFRRARDLLSPMEKEKLKAEIYSAIEPIDVAGLTDLSRRNWFPVDPRDLITAAAKLNASEAEVHQLLARCGFL